MDGMMVFRYLLVICTIEEKGRVKRGKNARTTST